ncbi:MAG: hypothetical protein HKN16_11460 [Saprospiraceae bacterium]|nr:hypothetical protein [Saprospiraceae bacterium]
MANLTVDRNLAFVRMSGKPVEINEIEFEILWAMINKPGKFWTAEDLESTFPPFSQIGKKSIRVAMESLNSKMSSFIRYDHSRGFKFRRA